MKRMNKIGLMVLTMMLVSVCHANIVSWNYNAYSDAYGTQSTDVAGVGAYLASYWNDHDLDGRTNNLLDNTGAETTIDISWSSYNEWYIQASHPGPDDDGSYNREVINGYLNAGPANWNPWTTESSVTLLEVPYTFYDIVVYFSSDVAGREGYVTDDTTTYYFNTLGPASVPTPTGNAVFVQAADTTEAGHAVAANYAVFSSLTGDNQTVRVQMRDIDEWAGIAAVQVVESFGDYGGQPDPADGETAVEVDLSERDIADNLSWIAPNDPNIAELKGYDLYLDPNDVKVSTRDSGCLIKTPVAAGVTQYNPPSDFANDETYYWIVDTRYTRDDDPNLGTADEQILVGTSPVYSFETIGAAPVIVDFNNVTTLNTQAILEAHITDSTGDLVSVDFELLTDDVDFPAGATFTEVSRDVSDLYNPSITVNADLEGFYKVLLTVTDGDGNTDEQIGEVARFPNDDPNACDARQWMWTWTDGTFNTMDFDQDCDVDLADFAAYAAQWLDDVKLTSDEQYVNIFVPYTPFEKIRNGDFETGDLSYTGWTDSVAITDVDPIAGNYSVEWTVATDGQGGIGWYVPVHASTNYTFSLTLSGGDASGEFAVRYGIGNDLATGTITPTTPPATTTLSIPFTTGAGDEGVNLECYIWSDTDGAYYKIDDVQITSP